MRDSLTLYIAPVVYSEGTVINSVQHGVAYGENVLDNITVGNCFKVPHGLTKVCIIDRSVWPSRDMVEHWFVTTDDVSSSDKLRTAKLYPVSIKIVNRQSSEAFVSLCINGIDNFLCEYGLLKQDGLNFTKFRLVTDWVKELYPQHADDLIMRYYESFMSGVDGVSTFNCARILPNSSYMVAGIDNGKLSRNHPWGSNSVLRPVEMCDLQADFYDMSVTQELYTNTHLTDECITAMLNVAANRVCTPAYDWCANFLTKNYNATEEAVLYVDALNNIRLTQHAYEYDRVVLDRFNSFRDASRIGDYVPLTEFSSEILFFCVELQQLPVPEIGFTYILSTSGTVDIIVTYCDCGYTSYLVSALKSFLKMLFEETVANWQYKGLTEIKVLKASTDDLFIWFKSPYGDRKYYIDLTISDILSQELCY